LERALVCVQGQAPVVGWKWVIADRVLRRFGLKELRLKVHGINHRVACRFATPDIYEYTQSLGRLRTPLDIPYRPEFIVDAGANVGYSALRFHTAFPDATIIAIEPELRNIIQLQKNCGQIPNIILEQGAVWSTNARLRIRQPHAAANAFQVDEDTRGNIEGISIDEVMRRHRLPRIDLLKIDIEGSEKSVLSHPGVKNWLPSIGMILIETHDRMVPGCTQVVDRALANEFDFRGHINEYAFYVSRKMPRRDARI
jgi:FkbM family methyltransferase